MNVYDAEFSKLLVELYLKASQDPEFKNRLTNDAAGVLREHQVDIPENFNVKFTDDLTIGIPFPTAQQLTDEELEGVSGGDLSDIGDFITEKVGDFFKDRDTKRDQKTVLGFFNSLIKAKA